MAGMHEASNLAIDGARVPVDDEDGLVRRADQVGAEQAGAPDRTVRRSPLGQVSVQRLAHSRDDVHFTCVYCTGHHEKHDTCKCWSLASRCCWLAELMLLESLQSRNRDDPNVPLSAQLETVSILYTRVFTALVNVALPPAT